MTRLDSYFEEYGAYHRDARNEATHAIGIPMIVLAVVMWASHAQFGAVDLALLLIAAAAAFYVWLSPALGLAMTAILAALYVAGVVGLGANALVALGLFAAGWALQFVGHHFEGRRPAFTRNAMHLLVGPLWILDRALARVGSHRSGHGGSRSR